jgi:hypothetical protein
LFPDAFSCSSLTPDFFLAPALVDLDPVFTSLLVFPLKGHRHSVALFFRAIQTACTDNRSSSAAVGEALRITSILDEMTRPSPAQRGRIGKSGTMPQVAGFTAARLREWVEIVLMRGVE